MNLYRTPIGLKVSSISDLARLAISYSTPMSPPRTLFRIRNEGKTIIALILSFPNYYELRGLPLTFYFECEEGNAGCKTSSYLSYRVIEGGEQVQFTDKSLPGWVMIPVINVEEIKELKGLLSDEG
ncbi:MAG: hypothetical protein C0177_04370 [Fervidicoccus fontis]|nr:MAG: hypothetical protein C0177_04370 [Fervidicoccus fontis]